MENYQYILSDIFVDHFYNFNLYEDGLDKSYLSKFLFRFAQINKFWYYESKLIKNIINRKYDSNPNLFKKIMENKEYQKNGKLDYYDKLYIKKDHYIEELKEYASIILKNNYIFYYGFDGDIDKFNNTPILNLKKKMGGTRYIDFILNKKLKYPIMRGYDCYDRPFLVLRYWDGDDFNIATMCVFQRYSDDCKVVCGSRYHNHLHYEGPGIGCNGFFWFNMMMNGYKCPNPYDVENNHEEIKILFQYFDKFEWVLKY